MKRDSDSADTRELLAQLERLVRLKSEDRRSELARIAAQQPALAARLAGMLDRTEQAEAWFDGLEQALGRGLAAELDLAWAPGQVIGPYRLECLLATGGMDAVFLARKADGELKRPVALKLVPPGLVNAATLARVRRERDLVASLSHPHIAHLLDAGITEGGQPWFAMEYIEGVDLLEWSHAKSTGVIERIRVFVTLVDAVRFAHRNLVVHGDLKPGNVLIDSSGRLRLLDFGIARLLDEMATGDGVSGFTPGFAAPEVIDGGRAGVASDIYSLGVMLRELIALPAAPSRRWPKRELELIAERAAHPDPQARYESARHLGDDLSRWLAREPVEARSGGALYRMGKRIQRHPLVSFAIVVATVAVVAFAIFSRMQAERFSAQRDSARQLATFMEQVFLGADPENARGATLSARELLDRGLQQLDSGRPEVTPDAAVRARFVSILGRTYQRLGDYPTAERLLHQALASDALQARTRMELRLELADNHHLNGRFDEAEAAYRDLLDNPAVETDRARALAGLGRTLAQTGRPQEAVELLGKSVELTRAAPDHDPRELAQRLNGAGSAWFALGQYDRAVALLDQALSIRRTLDGADPDRPGSPATATLLNNLGLMHYLKGRPARAGSPLRESLELRRQLLAPDHPDLAQTLTNLGLMLKDYGDSGEAAALLREALEVRRAGLEPDHYRIGQAMLNLAIAVRANGDHASAETLFEDALIRLERDLGAEHPQVAVAHTELGELHLEIGRLELAEAEFRRSLAIRRNVLNEGHPHLAWSLLGLGRVLLARGRRDEALPLLREAVTIRQRVLPPDNPLRLIAEDALREAEGATALD